MSGMKERLLGAITVMNDTDAKKLWDFVLELCADGWDAVEEVEPDPVDLQMLHDLRNDPDCRELADEDEVKGVLG